MLVILFSTAFVGVRIDTERFVNFVGLSTPWEVDYGEDNAWSRSSEPSFPQDALHKPKGLSYKLGTELLDLETALAPSYMSEPPTIEDYVIEGIGGCIGAGVGGVVGYNIK